MAVKKIYYSMGEVAEMFDVSQALVRHWESQFDCIKPHRNKKGNRMFTEAELPVGSVIEVADGWQYRPEAWKSEGAQTSRPNITATSRVTVTESWWGDYTHRAFNLSKIGTPSLENAADEIETALVIWIPKP